MILVSASFQTQPLHCSDWPQWRGPNRNGKSTETGLLKEWPQSGPRLIWTKKGLGGGYSSPSVSMQRIVGSGYVDGDEFIWALDENSGQEVWRQKVAEAETNVGYGDGPRSTPTIDKNLIFTLSAGGEITCLHLTKGRMFWQRNLKKEFGGRMMSGWGFSESILVDGRQVICTPGGRQGTVLALHRSTGRVLWQSRDLKDDAAYTSLIKVTIGGKEQYVVLTEKTLAGIQPQNGKVLWKAKRHGETAVIPTPIYYENEIFVTSGYNVGCNLFRITPGPRFTVQEIYKNKNIKNHHGGVIQLEDYLYASNGPVLVCMEMKTGKVAWKQRSVGKGSLSYADGHLYLRSENGSVALVEANPSRFVEKSRFHQPYRSGNKSWAHPVIANGQLYLRDMGTLLCFNLKE